MPPRHSMPLSTLPGRRGGDGPRSIHKRSQQTPRRRQTIAGDDRSPAAILSKMKELLTQVEYDAREAAIPSESEQSNEGDGDLPSSPASNEVDHLGDNIEFGGENRLRRAPLKESSKSITGNRGVLERHRDSEMDEGDSDVFLVDHVREAKRKALAVKKSQSKPREKAVKGKGKAATRDPLRETGSDDEEIVAGPSTTRTRARRRRAPSLPSPEPSPSMSRRRAVDGERGPTDEDQDELPAVEQLTAKKKGKARQRSAATTQDPISNDGFEQDEEELNRTVQESEAARQERQQKARTPKRKAIDGGDGEDPDYVPGNKSQTPRPRPGSSSNTNASQTSQPSQKKPRLYKYATGGNLHGRKQWTEEEVSCLMAALRRLAPEKKSSANLQVWSRILQEHGPNGYVSIILAHRNNVQLKDKTRNEIERIKRGGAQLPEWLEAYT